MAGMKQNLCRLIASLLLALGRASSAGAGEAESSEDQTLSPYFLVMGEDSGSDVMPLKSTTVDVEIAGVMADVRITQVYGNAGPIPLEAVYVFPGSTRAAVYGMEMRIGERVLAAQVRPREEARQTFETAKSEGKSTSLLEQQRPNVFQMSVANILPGDSVAVDLRYTEMLVPASAEYEFVFPAVVGPRYSNQPEAGAPDTETWVKNPYLRKGVDSPSTLEIQVELTAGMPLQDLRSPSHAVTPEFVDASHARVRIDSRDGAVNDRDFILNYRLADSRIESGLLLSRGGKENFFLVTVQPPKRVSIDQLPPREYIFVVDVSGSMNGFPLDVSKGLIKQLLGALRPEDSFNVLLFAGDSTVLSPVSLPADAGNVRRALDVIDRQSGGGGTELLPALRRALALPGHETTSRSIVVITDGYVSVETQTFDLIRANLHRANLFAFGIGSSVNRFLIEGMARAGQGEPFVVTKPDEAERTARRFRDYIGFPVLTRIRVEAEGFETYDVEPAAVADVLAERPVVVFGKWKGAARGTISVRGQSGEGEYVQQFPVAAAQVLESTPALAYLWARSRIATLGDYQHVARGDEQAKEIARLGMTYNLLTAYTSFVAVDREVRNAGGPLETVKQPLPLPKGVENSAVGGGAPISSAPEPETWMLLLAVAAIVLFRVTRFKTSRRCA